MAQELLPGAPLVCWLFRTSLKTERPALEADLSRLGGSIQPPNGQRPHPVDRYPIERDFTLLKFAVNPRILALASARLVRHELFSVKFAAVSLS
jgi:hypothetical protein